MFFDLNVQLLDERTLSAVVEMLIRLGYDGCAINQVSKGRFPPSLVNKAAGNFFKKSVFLMYFAWPHLKSATEDASRNSARTEMCCVKLSPVGRCRRIFRNIIKNRSAYYIAGSAVSFSDPLLYVHARVSICSQNTTVRRCSSIIKGTDYCTFSQHIWWSLVLSQFLLGYNLFLFFLSILLSFSL